MKTFAICLFAAVVSAERMTQLDYDYIHYVSKFNKVYDMVEEFNMRKEIFAETDARIKSVNENPDSTYRAGHNKFSDWTWEEYNAMLGLKNLQPNKGALEQIQTTVETEETADAVPMTWDWRSGGVVSDVKNQGSCGSCWAFSTVEALESAWRIAGNDLVNMSPQELVDCSSSAGNLGCNGGWYFWAYDWLNTNYIMLDSDYPYTAKDGTCQYDASKGITTVSSYKQVGADRTDIKNAIYTTPVNVAVAAGNAVFRDYKDGVVTINDGCPTEIDHAIVAVGWGIDQGTEYYIVRNSWGADWGQDGYIWLATEGGTKGVCGINQYVYYPII